MSFGGRLCVCVGVYVFFFRGGCVGGVYWLHRVEVVVVVLGCFSCFEPTVCVCVVCVSCRTGMLVMCVYSI